MKINKLKIALKKAIELSQYVYKNELGDLESENGICVDSALLYDVISVLDDEIKHLERKEESRSARALLL